MNKVKLKDFKAEVEKTNDKIDRTAEVELETVYFDKLVWTTLKAICIERNNKTAWIARSVIFSIDFNEPFSVVIPTLVNVRWTDKGGKGNE